MSLLAIRTTEKKDIEGYVDLAMKYRHAVNEAEPVPQHQGTVCLLFYENSTRTRLAFERAARLLGLACSHVGAATSSASKGESLRDTATVLDYEGVDCLVIRHPVPGAPQVLEEVFGGGVINAGDGCHEHPTQALTDLVTIIARRGSVAGLTVAIVGDIQHSRVARSNAWCLTKMGAKVRFVAPDTLLPRDCSAFPVEVYDNLAAGLADADVVMALRVQKERMTGTDLGSLTEYTDHFQINRHSLQMAKKDALVMHPGPMNRGAELDNYAADGPQSTIQEQVANGVYVRMAVLAKEFDELRGEQ